MSRIHTRSATELAEEIREGDRSPVEVVEHLLDRIDERNDRTNAFVTVTRERALDRAKEAERAVEAGESLGPLHGVPVAVKDLNDVAGVRTTSGSLLFEDRIAESSDPFVRRLIDAGAIVIGKTNTPEFGLGCTTDNRVVGPTGTPFDPTRIAGGSSGGAAAALADRLVPLAQGTDTGGSIRTPASCCNVFGLKPSFGRVPRVGRPNAFGDHTPFSHTGPMTRTVEDAALMLDVMAGPDPRDPFSLPDEGTDYLAATREPIDDLEVAYSPNFGVYPVASSVRSVVDDAVGAFEDAGATVERADPDLDLDQSDVLDAFYTFAKVKWEALFDGLEAEHGLDPRGEDRSDLRPITVETILESDSVTTREYKSADGTRTRVYDAVVDLLGEYDVLVTPTLGVEPFPHGEHPTEIEGTEIEPLRGWLLTQPFNFSGHPVGAVPAGISDDGLPVGMQVVGRRQAEEDVLAASAAIERERPWHDDYPA
ncbi:Asp-tRNAAsn/Glu-tRNAGln amidotransferase A subunit [Halorubrum aquaticum]|uniref:Asp-tRNAAsn/Glu-tRNAGln amidotransferase A subunit n=1 Tax=Halorubrum aquaticum TaxID=387340 RepID=A0A1I3B8P0_9EURY|nr:amidase [Halorubrum aquaticum]SFH58570.1 Asp-tRNAAsn/Glu-tRNAGln amidotransferase A subunit [Halorubrum aquaticum]